MSSLSPSLCSLGFEEGKCVLTSASALLENYHQEVLGTRELFLCVWHTSLITKAFAFDESELSVEANGFVLGEQRSNGCFCGACFVCSLPTAVVVRTDCRARAPSAMSRSAVWQNVLVKRTGF